MELSFTSFLLQSGRSGNLIKLLAHAHHGSYRVHSKLESFTGSTLELECSVRFSLVEAMSQLLWRKS